jgi:predicted GNAT superfamily acetyltransferase
MNRSIRFTRPTAQIYTASMATIIRDITTADIEAVHGLNQSEVPHVGSVDLKQVCWYAEHADYFRILDLDKQLAAFLVGFRPGSTYNSPNYRWFCDQYDEFAYVDRIAVAAFARRSGLATALYDDFAATLPASVPIMTCEVNIKPPNESSMIYHRRLGFAKVGSLSSSNGDKEVAMLVKQLHAD